MTENVRDIRMEIKGLLLDPSSNVPVVMLKEEGGSRHLPIWIGVFEANAIALRLDGCEPQRPMTHDLLRSAFEELGADVERIVISDLRDSTFYALIYATQQDRSVVIDARPSDAIALALRAQVPIYVRSTVLDKAQAADQAAEVNDEQLKKWLEELNPDDLGKYTM
ncbi:MAG TPA: bifunctional nuclease family protein [Thermoanaerobaculia bacterium]|nr:bifunctional nuclease family protein [Thermoanaerobaculia bacterium]